MSNILTNNINPRSGNLITIGGVNDRVSIAGTLSYNDVTNIDSVGVITARSGIDVGPTSGIGITLTSAGTIIAAGKVRSGGNANTGAAAGALLSQEGNIQVARSNAPGTVFQGYTVGNSTPTTVINANGNATFAGNLGINCTAPGSRLELNAAAATVMGISLGTVSDTITASRYIGICNGTDQTNIGTNSGFSGIEFGGPSSANEGYLAFHTHDNGVASGERMRIDKSGRMLLGLTSDQGSGNLQVKETIAACRISTSTASGQNIGTINFSDARPGTYGYIKCQSDNTPGTNDYPGRLMFATTENGSSSPSERMRITSQGTLSARANATQQARWGSLDGSSFQNSENYTIIYGNSANNYVLTRACNTADGTPVFDAYVGGSRRIEIEADGDVYNVNFVYGQISDIKLKENIIDSGSQWDDIKALRVRKFNFKAELGYGTKTQIGFIAQEVEEVSPGLVKTKRDEDTDGNDLGTETKLLKMSLIHVKAVKALQEAMTRIETLEQRLTDAGL